MKGLRSEMGMYSHLIELVSTMSTQFIVFVLISIQINILACSKCIIPHKHEIRKELEPRSEAQMSNGMELLEHFTHSGTLVPIMRMGETILYCGQRLDSHLSAGIMGG